MLYPIEVSTIYLTSTDGGRSNKFYELILAKTSDGRALVISRFGKNNGGFGTLVPKIFKSVSSAENEFEQKFRQKTGKGYTVKSQQDRVANDATEMRSAFGPAIWPALPAQAVNHLDPSIDTSMRKQEADQPRFDEDGKFLGDPKPKTFSQAEIDEARRIEEEERQARLAAERAEQAQVYVHKVANFGRF